MDFLLDGEPKQIYEALMRTYPPGHNPKPRLARGVFRTKLGTTDDIVKFGEQMVRDLREKWIPTWNRGRKIPDFHNWIADYDPDADIAPDKQRSALQELEGL